MHNRSTAMWLSLAVVVISALLAGFGIAWMGGGLLGRSETSPYTPPPTRTATATARTAALVSTRPATQQPAVAVTPLPSRPVTATAAPAATSTATAATASTSLPATAAATTVVPVATLRPSPTTAPAAQASPAAGQAVGQFPAGPVNLRSGPGPAFPVLGLAPEGGTYAVTARSADGEWWQVCCVGGVPAWAASSVISVTGSIETLPVLDR